MNKIEKPKIKTLAEYNNNRYIGKILTGKEYRRLRRMNCNKVS